MAAFVAADVAYTMITQRTLSDSRKFNQVKLVFGAGSETYATGGIPLTIGKMGCPVVVESLTVVDNGGSAYVWSYDKANKKLKAFQAPAQTHDHDLKIIGGQTHDATLGLNGSELGKNAATNITLNGANSATTGGVLSETLSAAGLVEVANATDIATQTLYVEVIGY